MRDYIPFSGNPLDRASNLRRNEAWIHDQFHAAESRFLAFHRLNVLAREAEAAGLRWLDHRVREYLSFGAEPLLLGVHEGVAHFAVDLSALDDPVAAVGI